MAIDWDKIGVDEILSPKSVLMAEHAKQSRRIAELEGEMRRIKNEIEAVDPSDLEAQRKLVSRIYMIACTNR